MIASSLIRDLCAAPFQERRGLLISQGVPQHLDTLASLLAVVFTATNTALQWYVHFHMEKHKYLVHTKHVNYSIIEWFELEQTLELV